MHVNLILINANDDAAAADNDYDDDDDEQLRGQGQGSSRRRPTPVFFFSDSVHSRHLFFLGGVGISPGPDFALVLPMGVAFSMRPISVAYTWPVRAAVDG